MLMRKRQKMNSVHLLQLKDQKKMCNAGNGDAVCWKNQFLEREGVASL